MAVIVKELILGIVSIIPAIIRALKRKGEKRKADALEAQKRKNAGMVTEPVSELPLDKR